MSAPDYILDTPLPLTQDFRSLRGQGLAYIQQYGDGSWTNFNASDPGVTILDQVCFALTELGYCGDFPIEDILSRIDDQINFKNQFYLPQDILTASPITSNDYIKYIVDGVKQVQNAIVVPLGKDNPAAINEYQVYLLIDNNDATVSDVCLATFYYLNSARNLGEKFRVPLALKAAAHLIAGTIEITDVTQLDAVIRGIDQNIRDFIFPVAFQSGYRQLATNGLDINEVFNGPLLKNGWIPADHLGKKADRLRIIDLFNLINSVPGVKSVSAPAFDNSIVSEVACQQDELLVIDLVKSIENGLRFTYKGSPVDMARSISPIKSQVAERNIQLGAAEQVQTAVPKGKYRDINSYYSIQNTFPETYNIGASASDWSTSAQQVAQSRQLKGYLTLFDQVLANQFSQLANIDRLFSFQNSLTGAPSDEREYYAVKDKYGRERPEYPAPYLYFMPAYFYQSLYEVPSIRPLLKNFDTLKFSPGPESTRDAEHKSWIKYKEDPYNTYIWGLKEFIEEESDSFEKRETMLDHLLARHGESAVMINTIVDGSIYTGDSRKDRIIFKSLFLQNLGLLSYYRQKAYNYINAARISAELPEVPKDCERKILGGYTIDFIFDSGKIDDIERLKESDFEAYSAIELKLNMLFGLKVQYKNYIVDNYENIAAASEIKLAWWMISKRKGVIFIESALLLPYLNFEIITTATKESGQCLRIDGDLDYIRVQAAIDMLANSTQAAFIDQLQNKEIVINNEPYKLIEADSSITNNQWYKPIGDSGHYFTIRLKKGGEIRDIQNGPLPASKAVIVLPAFIQQYSDPAFKTRLAFFIQNTLPVQLDFNTLFATADELGKLIPAYCDWHNELRYKDEKQPLATDVQLSAVAGSLASIITEINNAQL